MLPTTLNLGFYYYYYHYHYHYYYYYSMSVVVYFCAHGFIWLCQNQPYTRQRLPRSRTRRDNLRPGYLFSRPTPAYIHTYKQATNMFSRPTPKQTDKRNSRRAKAVDTQHLPSQVYIHSASVMITALLLHQRFLHVWRDACTHSHIHAYVCA